jgi:hypothetical protein
LAVPEGLRDALAGRYAIELRSHPRFRKLVEATS